MTIYANIFVRKMVKTIRVSDDEYDKIVKARKELARRGYGRLPDDVEKEVDVGSFTFGAIVAIGALALLYLLSKNGE